MARSSATTYCFVNGTSIPSTGNHISGTIFNSTSPLKVGGDGFNSGGTNGFIDEYRLSVGVARWTSNFTPPSQPYDTALGFDLEPLSIGGAGIKPLVKISGY